MAAAQQKHFKKEKEYSSDLALHFHQAGTLQNAFHKEMFYVRRCLPG